MEYWESPDKKIQKYIITHGNFGLKPELGTKCTFKVTNSIKELEAISSITIGDEQNVLERYLVNCLRTMNKLETATFKLKQLQNEDVSVTITLTDFEFDGFIYEWDAKKKLNYALRYKDLGVNLFKLKNNKEAAIKFITALKILSIIPIDVETKPDEVDGVAVSEIEQLKANLFNNLSSCYFRNNKWQMVIDLCSKVLAVDNKNVKALYKIAVAYMNDRNFEKSAEYFKVLLEIESDNKNASEKLKYVESEIHAANLRVNSMIKQMFK